MKRPRQRIYRTVVRDLEPGSLKRLNAKALCALARAVLRSARSAGQDSLVAIVVEDPEFNEELKRRENPGVCTHARGSNISVVTAAAQLVHPVLDSTSDPALRAAVAALEDFVRRAVDASYPQSPPRPDAPRRLP